MKIKLNLLPEKRVKEMKKKNILRFVIWQEIVVIFMVGMFLVMIKSADVVINLRLSSLDQQLSSLKLGSDFKKIDKYESNFRGVNKKLFLVEKVQRDNIDWLNIFNDINDAVPDGITIDSLENNNHTVSMTGIATTRDRLIVLKGNLDKIDCFTKVNVPLNDIVLKKNIDFQIDFKVINKCLSDYEK